MMLWMLLAYIAVLLLLASLHISLALWLIFISFILVIRNKRKIKGYIGEQRVHRILQKLGKEYKVFHDVYVRKKDGKMTQLDHVVVSKYGIFVLETKNYKGWIFGEEEERDWTQVIYKNRQSFYNPILQNRAHVRSLQHVLHMESGIYSIIIFSDVVTFKFNEPFATAQVIQTAQLTKTISHYKTVVFSDEQVKVMMTEISKISNVNKMKKLKTKREHRAQFKQFQQPQRKVATKRCPQCGQQLMLKSGKYGEFYGCAGYPTCCYTKKCNEKTASSR
ncbi:MAG: NERD domain-containing protein [Solibacillus sp.]